MGWRRTGHRKRVGERRDHRTRFRYSHHRAEERDRSNVTAESRNRQARSTAMAWGRFSGRWRQFKLNHRHARWKQLRQFATQPGQRASAAVGTAAVAVPNVMAAIEAVSVFVIRVSMSVGLA